MRRLMYLCPLACYGPATPALLVTDALAAPELPVMEDLATLPLPVTEDLATPALLATGALAGTEIQPESKVPKCMKML